MMREDIKELKEYISTLIELSKQGFNCKNEISMALEKLHEEYGFNQAKIKKPTELKKIIIIDSNSTNLKASFEMYNAILEDNIKRAKSSQGYAIIVTDSIEIQFFVGIEKATGLRYDFIHINGDIIYK